MDKKFITRFSISALLIMTALNVAGAVKHPLHIISFKVIPISCHFPGCDPKNHGNLRITYSNHSSKVIDSTGLVNNDSKDQYRCPQISPDRKTIGWITDTHMIMDSGTIRRPIDLSEAKKYKPTEKYESICVYQVYLNLYRDGHKITKISGYNPFILKWMFFDKGSKVGVESMANHGASYLELFDTASGKRLAGYNENADNLPQWAMELSE